MHVVEMINSVNVANCFLNQNPEKQKVCKSKYLENTQNISPKIAQTLTKRTGTNR